jgi:hypothetical protein
MAGLLDIFGTSGADTMGLLGMSQADIARNREDAQAQALYALAGRLFQGGNTGQSIAEGLQAGQKAYRGGMQESLQGQLQNVQLADMLRKRQQEQQDMLRKRQLEQQALAEQQRIQGVIQGAVTKPQEMYGEDMMGQQVGEGMTAGGFDLQRAMPQLMSSPEGRKALTELIASQKAMGGETTSLAEGAKLIRVNPFTNKVETVAEGAPKEKASPADIQGYNLAVDQGYKGSFLDYQTSLKRAGATNIAVGDKSFQSEFGKGVAEAVTSGYQAAQGAVGTLNRIQTLKPLVADGKVFSGTLGGAQVQASRIADAFGIGGANNTEKLQNTALAMQQLAGLELNAAEAMRGQGTITENERGLIRRAAGGDLMSMTAKEVSTLLNGLEKTSNYKIQIHETNLKRLSKNKDLAPLAEYYQLPTTPTVVEPSGLPAGVTVKKK